MHLENSNAETYPERPASSATIHRAKQIVSYLGVGIGTAALEFLLFQFLYLVCHVNVSVSNIVAVLVATICNFALNGTITFRKTSNYMRSLVLYILLFLFNTLFSTAAITFFVNQGAPAAIVKIITMLCIVVWNFFLYKKVVFL